MLLKIKPKLSAQPLGSTAESDLGSGCLMTRTQGPVLRHFQAPAKADRGFLGGCLFFAVTPASFQWHSRKLAASSALAPLPSDLAQPATIHVPKAPIVGLALSSQPTNQKSSSVHPFHSTVTVLPTGTTIYTQLSLKMWYLPHMHLRGSNPQGPEIRNHWRNVHRLGIEGVGRDFL